MNAVLVPSGQAWGPSTVFSPSAAQQIEHCESKMTHHAAVPVKLIREAKEIVSSSVRLLC